MNEIIINVNKLPTFASLNTAHWPGDLQNQFSKAIEGIESAEWFQNIPAQSLDKERLATSLAFAAFSHLRSRLNLAPDEELMLDGIGRKENVTKEV